MSAAAANPAVQTAVTKASTSAYILYRLARTYTRNTRITPIATYLAYKASGYADTGSVAGMTISDFVSVWTPYNVDPKKKKVMAGTKPATAKIVKAVEGREGRPARQSVKWGQRRRHFCRQEGCGKVEV